MEMTDWKQISDQFQSPEGSFYHCNWINKTPDEIMYDMFQSPEGSSHPLQRQQICFNWWLFEPVSITRGLFLSLQLAIDDIDKLQ